MRATLLVCGSLLVLVMVAWFIGLAFYSFSVVSIAGMAMSLVAVVISLIAVWRG